MSTMYELTSDYLSILAMADDLDISPEVIADTLEAIDGEIELKAEATAKVLRELSARAEGLKAEEKRMSEMRKRIEANAESLKNRLEDMMRATGKIKFKTSLFSFAIQKNGGKLPIIMDVDTADLPDDYVIINEKPDMDAIRKMIDEGDCPYAHYGDRGESLRIK